MLLDELKELQRLTAFEQAVATVRRTQAANTAVAQELAANASKAGERLALLAQAVRGAGGTPDVVGPVLGRLGALLQTQVNQVQTLQGALLGDLALEHQLRERARYARTLAVTLGEMSTLPVLDRLDAAHSETIAWLERRLGEVARTGSSALKATPLQLAVGSVRRVVGAPFDLALGGVNQLGALVGKLTRQAPAAVSQVQEAAGNVPGAAVQAADTAANTAAAAAGSAVDAAADLASSAVGTAGTAASTAVDTASDLAGTAADTVSDLAGTAADTVSDLAGGAVDTASDLAGSAVDTATEVTARTADTASDLAGTAADAASSAADTAADVTSGVADTAAGAIGSAADTAAGAASSAADTAAGAANSAADATTSAADTAAEATKSAAETAEEITHEVLDLTGGDDVSDAKPPFAGYERLSGDSIMRHVDDTEDIDELRTLLAFEQAHKARKGVLKAAQSRLSNLAASV
jgi:bacterioferritin (cytochrome b1)